MPAGPSSRGALAAEAHEASSSHRGSARSCSSPISSTVLIPLSPPTTSRQRSHTLQPHAPAEDVLASAVWTRQGSRSCSPRSRPQPQDPAAATEVEQPRFSGDAAADVDHSRHAAAAGMEGLPRLQLEKIAAAGQGAATSNWDCSAAHSSGPSDCPSDCQRSSGDTSSDSSSSSCYNSADSQSMQSHLSPPPAQHEGAEGAVSSEEASSLQPEPQLVSPRPAQAAQGSLEGRSEGSPGLQEPGLQSAARGLAAGLKAEGAAALLEGAAAVASQAAAASGRRQGTLAAPMQQPMVHLLDASTAGINAEGGCTAVTGSTTGMQPQNARSGLSGGDDEATQPASPRHISAQSGSPRCTPPASQQVNQLSVLWAPAAH